jgi:acetyl esterase/lipase
MKRRTSSTIWHVKRAGLAIVCAVALGVALAPQMATALDPPRIDDDGTIHVLAFDLPESSFLSIEARVALKQIRTDDAFQVAFRKCPPIEGADRATAPAIRQCQADAFYKTEFYKGIRARYAVTLAPQEIRGVYTEVFTPSDGIAPTNRNRVLINLHGGSFYCCARINSHLESIPIASVGRIKVVSIDYRQAPESVFPAASEDVAAVYQELLKRYKAKNIGLYGCSAGGALTAQAMAWFQREKLPLPGAIGMFCFGSPTADSGDALDSDSGNLSRALTGLDVREILRSLPDYYHGVDRKNPLASPGDYDEIMAKFPPSLLISGTRDLALSSVLATHAQLARLGVIADLHVWEGMSHAFQWYPALPESREAYEVIARFFDKHLGH